MVLNLFLSRDNENDPNMPAPPNVVLTILLLSFCHSILMLLLSVRLLVDILAVCVHLRETSAYETN